MPEKNYRNGEQDRRIDKVEGHIENTNRELGEVRDNIAGVKIDVAKVKVDVAWLKKFFFIIATASVGGLAVGVINLLMR